MHSAARHRHGMTGEESAPETKGLIIKGGWRYDFMEWFHGSLTFGSQMRKLRQRTVALASLQPGEQALDVGCGTGTLALLANQRVGHTGRVVGIDPSAEQIARARQKAARRHAPVEFQLGVIERLPFPDQTFDVVFSTLMMHHLPVGLKRQGLAEIARVLKPGGRLVIGDFTRKQERTGRAARFHAGGSNTHDLAALVTDAGFDDLETEEMAPARFSVLPGVGFVRARKGQAPTDANGGEVRHGMQDSERFIEAARHQIEANSQHMQPAAGRAQHLVETLQELLAAVPDDVTLADLAMGWQTLARPLSQHEDRPVAHRRETCAQLAAIAAPLIDAPGSLAGAVRAWQAWQSAYPGGGDPRQMALAKTFARELVELQATAR